jgi:hypothetical protein
MKHKKSLVIPFLGVVLVASSITALTQTRTVPIEPTQARSVQII